MSPSLNLCYFNRKMRTNNRPRHLPVVTRSPGRRVEEDERSTRRVSATQRGSSGLERTRLVQDRQDVLVFQATGEKRRGEGRSFVHDGVPSRWTVEMVDLGRGKVEVSTLFLGGLVSPVNKNSWTV